MTNKLNELERILEKITTKTGEKMKKLFEVQAAVLTKNDTKILRTRFIEANNKIEALDLLEAKYVKLAKKFRTDIFKHHNHFTRSVVIGGFSKKIEFEVL